MKELIKPKKSEKLYEDVSAFCEVTRGGKRYTYSYYSWWCSDYIKSDSDVDDILF